MDKYNPIGMSKENWILSNPTIIDYHHHSRLTKESPAKASSLSTYGAQTNNLHLSSSTWQPSKGSNKNTSSNDVVVMQSHTLNTSSKPVEMPHPSTVTKNSNPKRMTSVETWHSSSSTRDTTNFASLEKYTPFIEEDMEISDDENPSCDSSKQPDAVPTENLQPEKIILTHGKKEVKSGAAFYQGLILYIPPFEQLKNTYKGSPAMKMLYASFEFSFKVPLKFETKPSEKNANVKVATVFFHDHIIATGSGQEPLLEASVRALELLSETCYTIQTKGDYFNKCKLIDGDNMKTLNLKKWEAVSQKYPKLLELTKDSHIQKTFAVFLDSHTSSGVYEDIVFCNLTRQDVNNIKRVAEFFHLTMLPCSVSTNLSKKQSPCVVSIQKYTSAQKLLDILIECGGENDKFKLYPPDTFKDFYKLHQRFWDPALKNTEFKNNSNTTLDDEELQATILKPYENTISKMFEKHKSLPKVKKVTEDILIRKVSDDFMKETLKIDMAHSKNVAPVERMQLLLKYMENLQEYGSRVLTSGQPEMIKIYHNAIDNLRKDLDICRKDIEMEQKEKSTVNEKTNETTRSYPTRTHPSQRRTSARRRSRSPVKQGQRRNSPHRSTSQNKKRRSSSPKRLGRSFRDSGSPPLRRRPRSRSPKQRPTRVSPSRKDRSPRRRSHSSHRRSRSPKPSQLPNSGEHSVNATIFQDQLKKYVEILRRFRTEIEDTPIERRSTLREKLFKHQLQFSKFYKQAMDNPLDLGKYLVELDMCKEELNEEADLVAGKPGPNDLPRSITPPPWMNPYNFEPSMVQSPYIPPNNRQEFPSIPPPPGVFDFFKPDFRYSF